ncbi:MULTISPECIES: DUF961 family protein [unclassified Enterococcus]|uniref:DUF961 family protein n=1 Tax=unclassified Enterococcus TaxID=2608891 RepID=UPI000A32E826|nr:MULTISPECIES: DUF961 family protein [unclassified Enterococcus]MBO0424506.1 DUF961 family protein [Enterococcus faecium]OTO34063.1 hypothetical protein A5870_001414 [Enterococcus sp. 2G9_DIV0600]OTO38691.1 hypothetical protein A5871_003277 [Enterococcus sp. 2F9_DIV0599]
MAKINELNKGISLNIEETFGELKFLRMKEDKKRENDEGELISTQVRYVVQSKRQVSEEIVSIDVSADRKEFEFGDQVKLINPRIEYYSFRQGNRTNNYLKVVADGIEKVQKKVDQRKPESHEQKANK